MRESRRESLNNLNKSNEINTQQEDQQERIEININDPIHKKPAKKDIIPGNESKKKKNLVAVRKKIKEKQPKQIKALRLDDLREEDNIPTIGAINALITEMKEDTGRSALYYKVRDVANLYVKEKKAAARTDLLLALRESAFNYLLEKKGETRYRKQRCQELIRMVDRYFAHKEYSMDRDLSYLVEEENIPDEKLDMELRLAGKLTVNDKDEFKGNLKDRRKIFRQRIKQVKLAREYKREMEEGDQWARDHMNSVKHNFDIPVMSESYGNAVSNIISGYMNMPFIGVNWFGMKKEDIRYLESTDERRERLGTNMLVRLSASGKDKDSIEAKGHMIESILGEILRWDPTEFSFNDQEDFLNRPGSYNDKKKNFLELRNKLKIAENARVLLDELNSMRNANLYTPKIFKMVNENDMIKELIARIELYHEINKEYTERLAIMESPYYALLTEKDLKAYDTSKKLQGLTEDKFSSDELNLQKKSVGERFKDYVKALVSKNKRHRSKRKTGGEFTKKTDVRNLYEWHRNKHGLSGNRNIAMINNLTKRMDEQMELDAGKEGGIWDLENHIKRAAGGRNQEPQAANENIQQNQNANAGQEVNAGQEANVQENRNAEENANNARPEVNEEQNAGQAANVQENRNAEENANPEQAEEQVQEERVNLLEELKEKQSNITKNSSARVAKLEAEMQKQRELLINREKTLRELSGKSSSISEKSKAWVEEFEKKEDEKTRISYLLEKYNDLAKTDITIDEAFNYRDRLIQSLVNITGVEKEKIEFTPMDKLAEFATYALKNWNVEDSKTTLKKQIADLDDSYSDLKDQAPMLDRVKKILEKGDKMTTQDKLVAYDYSTLVICINRNEEDGDVVYNNYKGISLNDLLQTAELDAKYRSTNPYEDQLQDEEFKKKEKEHDALCRQILSMRTGKDPDFFKVLPVKELSDSAYKSNNIGQKKDSEEAAKACIKHAEETHARIKLLDDVFKKEDRDGFLAAMKELSGVEADELKGFVTVEIKNILKSVYDVVYSPETIKDQTQKLVSDNKKQLGKDYYFKKMNDAHSVVWGKKQEIDGMPTFEDESSMAEYTILYLQQLESFKDLQFDDFDGLDAYEIYAIYRNIGIIEGLKNTKDPDEMNDRAKAIKELASSEMTEKLKTTLEKSLDVDFAKIPDMIKLEESSKVFTKDPLKAYKEPEWMTKQMQDQLEKRLSKMRRNKKNNQDPKADDRSFSAEAQNMLNILGDLASLSGQPVSEMKEKAGQVLMDRAGELVGLLKQNENKVMRATAVFSELKNSVGTEVKGFLESSENTLMPVINALSKTLSDQKEITEETIVQILKSGQLNREIGKFVDNLETDLDTLEKQVIPVMEDATSDIYNKGEAEENIPLVTDLMNDDMKELVRLVDEEAAEKRKAEAKTIKQKLELEKKSQEKTDQERVQLHNMQESLLYNGKMGQGRFNQLLVSGYYKNASKDKQRKMLSFIIRDIKKKGQFTTDKEIGCEYFASTMKGAGPLMQKMMQGIPERTVIPEMSVALGVVKSSLAHIDQQYVDKVFSDIQKDSKGAITSITDKESLGAASVAETFKCKIAGPKMKEPQEVVVKIRRPDAKDRMYEDLSFVRKAAMFADMSDKQVAQYEEKYKKELEAGKKAAKEAGRLPENVKVSESGLLPHEVKVTESGFLAQFSEIEKEFDFTTEAKNIQLGKENYVDKYNKAKDGSDNYHVKSVNLNENFTPRTNYLVMDLAKGYTVDKLITMGNEERKKTINAFRDPYSVRTDMVINAQNIGDFWIYRNNMIQSSMESITVEQKVADLAYVWLEQALFGSTAWGLGDDPNFHHGDLHAGNIMCDGTSTTVLDYGNAVILKDSKVNQILSMITSVVVNSAKDFVEAFNNMLELSAKDEKKSANKVGYAKLNEKQKSEFTTRLDKLFKLGTAEDTGRKILIALNVAQSMGVKLPKEIQNFSQCQQRLENTVQEIKNTAVRSVKLVDQMDNMEVAPEDMDSFDPLIKLHLYHKEPKNRNKEAIDKFYARYKVAYDGMLANATMMAQNKEELDEALKRELGVYTQLRAVTSPEKLKASAVKCKQYLREIQEQLKSDGKVSEELKNKLLREATDLELIIVDHDVFKGVMEVPQFFDLMEGAFSLMERNFDEIDEGALEDVMVIFEEAIPEMFEKVDQVYDLLKEVGKDPEKEGLRRGKVINVMSEAYAPFILFNHEAVEFRKRLRDTKTDEKKEEFERQAARLFKDEGIKAQYDKYREIEAELDKLKKAGTQDKIKEAQDKLRSQEYLLMQMFIKDSKKTLLSVSHNYKEPISLTELDDEDYMPDFVQKMGSVVEKHWKRSLGKINSNLSSMVMKQAKEQSDLEKSIEQEKKDIEKSKADKKKAAAAAKEKAAKEAEKKRKEAAKEAEKKRKEAEKKKKEAEKKRIAEEKKKQKEAKKKKK